MTLKKSLLIGLLALFVPGLARGEGNLHIGPLEIHPYVSAKETYSNNIYSTVNQEKRDYITITTPGLRLQLPFRAHQLMLDYNAVLTRYAKYDAENSTDHNANGLLDFKLGSLLGLKLQDAYGKNHEPRGASSTGFIERYETNTATASATYQLAEISKVQIDYAKSTWDYKRSNFRNRDEDVMSGYIYYRFLPKTSAFLEYDHKYVDYDIMSRNLNNNVDSALLGLTWEITERSKGTIKGGYLWKDFALASKKDYQTWTASIDLNYDFSDYTSLMLVGQRQVNEPSLSGTRFLVSTGGYAEFTHKFVEKLSAILHGSYGVDKFSEAVPPATIIRRDKTVTGGGGLNYLMKDWLKFGIDYTHKDKDSNMDASDYEENSYTLSISFAL